MESLGIYISVPFCRSKCTYCNFASGVFPESYHARYVERVVADIRSCRSAAGMLQAALPSRVDSLYFGGGTPSVLAPGLLRELFRALRAEFDVADAAEITLECAPGQLPDDVLAAMTECGVNRVSFGVQSFIDREAAVTGRLHTREGALRDIARVRDGGIRSINADLIAGLPHQTPASWRESLDVLVASGVDHASIYMLEVDDDSRLGRELLEGGARYHAAAAPADETVADMYSEAIEVLGLNGLAQYEISNFARNGAWSVHNCKYWLRQPYLGFGLDAHSMLPGTGGDAFRCQSAGDLMEFLERPGWKEIQPVSRRQALEEAWFLGLRLNEGVGIAKLEREFGHSEAHCFDALVRELEAAGLMQVSGSMSGESLRISLTDRGRLVSNDIFERFLEPSWDGQMAEQPDLVLVD